MLETIVKNLEKFPLCRTQPRSTRAAQAAVLVALIDDGEIPEIILTQRAHHLNNHAGEVAFPGGMWDAMILIFANCTARSARRNWFDPTLVDGLLHCPVPTPRRRSLRVTPFVGLLAGSPAWLEIHRRLARFSLCH